MRVQANRVAVLIDPNNSAATEATLREVQDAARVIALPIDILKAGTGREIEKFELSSTSRPPRHLASPSRKRCWPPPTRSFNEAPRVYRGARERAASSRGESLLADFSISEIWKLGRPETGCVSVETGSKGSARV